MYIDDINKIWDETINNYFLVWIIQKTKELINIDTLVNETNFVKFQKDYIIFRYNKEEYK